MRQCHIAFAGGSCGMTMMKVADKLVERCQKLNLSVRIEFVYLWVSDYLAPGTDLVVEMFPYYRGLRIPVISGRPFLSRVGEDDLYADLVDRVRDICQR